MTGEESIVTMPEANSTELGNRGSHLSSEQAVSLSAAAAQYPQPVQTCSWSSLEKELYIPIILIIKKHQLSLGEQQPSYELEKLPD